MKDNGTVYGFVGVIGSGKSYRAHTIVEESEHEGRSVIFGDFSEGIRQALMNIFVGNDAQIDARDEAYRKWKNCSSEVYLPFYTPRGNCELTTTCVDGRELLQNTAEYLKTLAGNDVWAKWTARRVTKEWVELPDEEAAEANIVFGSVRFPCEAAALFDTAAMTSKKVKIIFCDYPSSAYELADHESEMFAREFLKHGCKDGQDITDAVKNFIYYKL